MTVTVLSAAHSVYRSGEPNHALSFNVDAGALAIISAGASNLNSPSDNAWVPTITDGGRTWTLRGQNRTSAGAAWVYEWFNGTGSTAAVSATVVFPTMSQNDPVGHVAIQITGVDDPAVSTPVVTKNPTGDSTSTGHSNLEEVTLTVTTIGSQVVMFYGSWTGTIPTMRAGSSQSTTAPVSVDLEGGDGAYGCIWRTTTESATGSITIGATAPTSAFAGNIAIEYLPAATGGTPGTFTTSAGDAPSAGASATLTGAATFTASAGDAPATGDAASFTASATFTASAGDAPSGGAAASFTGAASFAANAGDAASDGGTVSVTGAATFTASAGDSTAAGSTASFTLPAPETPVPLRLISATGRIPTLTATGRTATLDGTPRIPQLTGAPR